MFNYTTFSKQKAPVATGNLRRNIKFEVSGSQSRVGAYTDYALFQEMGTGIFGAFGRPITPKRAKFLRFKSKTGKIIFAKSVKGTKGKRYMEAGAGETSRRTSDIDRAVYQELQRGLYA